MYRCEITIIKTSLEHIVWIGPELLKEINETFNGKEYLFESCFIGSQGKTQKQFTRAAINKRLKKYMIHPHQLRHSRATDMARENVSPKVIQNLLGHNHVNTTINYYFNDDSFNPTLHKSCI